MKSTILRTALADHPFIKALDLHFDGSWECLAKQIDLAQYALIQSAEGMCKEVANAHHDLQMIKNAAQQAAQLERTAQG